MNTFKHIYLLIVLLLTLGQHTFGQCTGDATNPVANCQTITVHLDASGLVIVQASDLDNGSTDNCGIANMLINNQSMWTYSCNDIGTQAVQFTVVDSAGNSATCPTTIQVVDTVKPIAVCQTNPIVVQLDPNGFTSITGNVLDAGSTDNCSIAHTMINGNTSAYEIYDCSNLGSNIANYIIMDGSGNTDTCQVNVVVQDNSLPVIACKNLTVYLGGNGTDTIRPNDIDNNSYDNCGIASLNFSGLGSQIIYDTSDVGTHSVVLTATDPSGNIDSCTAVITVIDTTGQNSCQVAATVINHVSCNGLSDGDAVATVSGAASPTTYLWSHGETHALAQNLPAGSYTVSITDASGCTDQATVVVTQPAPLQVTISTTPSLCTSNNGTMTANPTGGNSGGYFYQWHNGQTDQTLTNLSANYWNRVTVSDFYGCTATNHATVPTLDTVAPTISCVDTTLYLNQGGNAYMLSFDLAQQYGSDNCGITWSSFTTMGGPTAVYTCNQVGTFSETIIVYDGNNNSDSCTFNLTIVDTTAPVANCAIYTAYVSAANPAVVMPNHINDGSTDNCSINSLLINGASMQTYTTSNTGYNTVTLTVTDASGNTSNCNTWVYVIDTSLSPVANCVGSHTAYLNSSGYAQVNVNDIDNGSTGNNISYYINGSLGIGTSILPVSCNDLGSYNYNFIVTDNTNHQDTCSFVLNVVDTTAPSASCQTAYTLQLAGNTATLHPSDLDAGSADNCGINRMTVNGVDSLVFTCSQVGTAQWVVLTVEDAAGNTSSCQTLVYIMGGNCGVQASLVSANPSSCDTSLCTGAATVTASGGQNPYTFLWNDGDTNANRTGLCPAVYTVVVTDANSDTDTLLVRIGYEQGCVWPGDADDDAQVNNMDLLPIALAYGAPGFTRPNASLVWKGQAAPDWNIANPVPNLPDYKHIDCDGSALIDLTDVNAITQNYGLSYLRSNHSKSGNIPLYVASDTAYEKDRVGLSIYLGAPGNLATDVYAIAFTINYDPAVVEAGSTSIDYNNSWLGANLISVQKDFHSQGKIETAVGRINHINTSGFGQIGTFYITIRDDVLRAPIAKDMPIAISNVRLIDKDNNIIGTNNQTATLTVLEVVTSTTEIEEHKGDVVVFPNPSSGELTIKAANAHLAQLTVLSITGQKVMERSLNGQQQEQINLSHLTNGSYILSITTDKEVLNKRIIIRH